MKTTLFVVFLVTAVLLRAQASPEAQAQSDALKLRGDMADAVGQGLEQPDRALARLRNVASPTGLKIDADADFAFGAIDIGRRLIAAGKPAEAEQFFIAAEASLASVLGRTPDTAARDKAQYLQKLALIRSQYLNKVAEAKANLDEAIRLQPEDKHLQQSRDMIAHDKAEYFKDQAQPGRN